MKYMTTPKFAQNLAQLARTDDARANVSNVMSKIETAADFAGVLTALAPGAHVLSGNVYVVRAGDLRLFLTHSEEFVLLLDVAVGTSPSIGRGSQALLNQAPTIAGHRNPRVNGVINPFVNGVINPRVNGMINPRVNGMINPNVNGMINPRVNGMINPRVNGMINPRVNGAINPKMNGTINPRINPAYLGPYLYNLNLDPRGYLVRANEGTDLLFDFSGACKGTAIAASESVKVLFDDNQEWIGYLVQNGQDGYSEFDLQGEWTGFIV